MMIQVILLHNDTGNTVCPLFSDFEHHFIIKDTNLVRLVHYPINCPEDVTVTFHYNISPLVRRRGKKNASILASRYSSNNTALQFHLFAFTVRSLNASGYVFQLCGWARGGA